MISGHATSSPMSKEYAVEVIIDNSMLFSVLIFNFHSELKFIFSYMRPKYMTCTKIFLSDGLLKHTIWSRCHSRSWNGM